MSFFSDLRASRELLLNLTMREVRGQYKRTLLGQLWSLANPLALMLVFTFVFSFIFRVQPAPGDPSGLDVFALWLMAGLLPWLFFSHVVNGSMGSLIANAGLIQKVAFDRIVLPISTVGSSFYNWMFEMSVLVVALAIAGSFIWIWIPFTLLAMVVLAVFATGLGMMLSIANVYFRDTAHLMGIALSLWMYLTPVIYPISLIESQSEAVGPLFGTQVTLLDVYRANPMERFVEVFRNLMYDNRIPDLENIIFVVVAAIVSMWLGVLVFRKNERKLAEAL